LAKKKEIWSKKKPNEEMATERRERKWRKKNRNRQFVSSGVSRHKSRLEKKTRNGGTGGGNLDTRGDNGGNVSRVVEVLPQKKVIFLSLPRNR
jgi:hypothetical protein